MEEQSLEKKGLVKKNILDTPPVPASSSHGVLKERMEKVFAEVYSEEDPELPIIPERYRNFAFRWATEYKTNKEWSTIFRVSPSQIEVWKRHPKILRYYMIIRRKRNLVLMERMKTLEAKAFEKIYEILDLPVSDKNIDAIRKTIMNVLGVDVEGALNLRVSLEAKAASAAGVAAPGGSAGVAAASARAEVSLDLKQLKDKIEEMQLLESIVGSEDPQKEEVLHEEQSGAAEAHDEG